METLTIDPERAAQALLETHGIRAEALHSLGSELASTFRATTDHGTLAVKLQLSPAEETPVQRWRAELSSRLSDAGHPVPRILPASDGGVLGTVDVAGTPVSVLALDWIPVPPYSDAGLSAAAVTSLGTELGRVAGRMQHVLATCPAPPREIDHTWAMHSVARVISEHLDQEARLPRDAHAMGARALQIYANRIAPVASDLPRALVHQDLHDSNVLADEAGRILGVIDFDDAVVGWRIAEPVVAAAYLARHGDDPGHLASLVLAGWEEEVEVTAAEREAFLPLVAMRLALNAVVWAARAGTDRGDYAAARSRGSAATFERLAELVERREAAA